MLFHTVDISRFLISIIQSLFDIMSVFLLKIKFREYIKTEKAKTEK